jgi:hypothetical protein
MTDAARAWALRRHPSARARLGGSPQGAAARARARRGRLVQPAAPQRCASRRGQRRAQACRAQPRHKQTEGQTNAQVVGMCFSANSPQSPG